MADTASRALHLDLDTGLHTAGGETDATVTSPRNCHG